MRRLPLRYACALLSVLTVALAGCEEHTQRATRGAPEYLHEALSGDIAAQKYLVDCYGAHDACGGFPFDPALSCAWRGVRLAAQTADLTLADEAAFTSACYQGDTTFRQRFRLAREALTRRIYRKPAPDSTAAEPGGARLYPSMEMVRVRMNGVLAMAHAASLPSFGASQASPEKPRRLWKTCSPSVCLEGVVPGWGGGLYGYRATVLSATEPGHDRELAAELAGAGLEATGITTDLLTPAMFAPSRSVAAAGVCWSAGMTNAGQPFTSAAPEPC